MKKLFLLLLAVMAVFALVFTSCEAAVNPDVVTAGYTKLDNPQIQTNVYPGAIVVTWKPVKDAEGYRVGRIDNTTLQTKDLTARVGAAAVAGGGLVSLIDVVNYDNELVHGRSYTYVVTAYSSLNIGKAGAAAGDVTGNSSNITPVLNSQSERTVQANVPATITFPALGDLTFETFTNLNGQDFLKVSYPKLPDNQYNPGIGLRFTYSYGSVNTDVAPNDSIAVWSCGILNQEHGILT